MLDCLEVDQLDKETCKSEKELFDYCMDREDGDVDVLLESHLENCETCKKTIEEVNLFNGSLKSQLLPKQSHSSEVPSSIDKYRVEKEISRGGMGRVFLAKDSFLQRRVAIKVIRDDMTKHSEFRSRFLAETRILAQFSHPNITTIYNAGEDDGKLFLVMEYVEGKTLHHLRPKGIKQVFELFMQILEGVNEAHKQGVLHRDLKPSNMMLTHSGKIKIIDFGIAYSSRLQMEGCTEKNIIGSSQYVAPEVKEGEAYSVQSDIYSLGVILIDLISECTSEPISTVLNENLKLSERIQGLHQEPELQYLLTKLLQEKPDNRFSSIDRVIEVVDVLLKNRKDEVY